MKRILSALICLLLLSSLAMPVFAADLTVTFTADSLPEVGGTLTVDKNALMDNGSITAEMYNALLEGNVIYSWYKNGIVTKEGTSADALSYQLTLSDQGCTFYVEVRFYEDDSFQESKKCAEVVSGEITVKDPASDTPQEPTPPTDDPSQPHASDSTAATNDDHSGSQDNDQDFPWWGYAVIVFGGICVGIGIAFIFDKLKRKA